MLNVIFDLDGTLIDSGHDYPECLSQALLEVTGEKMTVDDIRFRLDGFDNEWYRKPGMSDEEFAGLKSRVDEYMSCYKRVHPKYDPLFDGAKELLDDLLAAGCRLHVCSARPPETRYEPLDRYGIRDRFTYVMGRKSYDDEHKEKLSVLSAGMKEYGLKPDECVLVGDLGGDIRAGNGCGVKTVAVTYGFGTRDRLEPFEPTYLVDSVVELRALLLSLNE